jgi:hypothetical protein
MTETAVPEMEESRAVIERHLSTLGQAIGEQLALDPDGMCLLETAYGTECVLCALAGSEDVVLSSPVGLRGEPLDATVCEALLTYNDGLATGWGAALCLEPGGKVIVLHQRRTVSGQDYDGFVTMLDQFFELQESAARDTLAIRQGETPPETAAGQDGGDDAPQSAPMLKV